MSTPPPFWLWGLAAVLFALCYTREPARARLALRRAAQKSQQLAPTLLAIILFVGMAVATLDAPTIGTLLGPRSGALGVGAAIAVGAIAFMPSFSAFPLGAALLEGGAGYPQVGGFLAALMGISLATLPLEAKYFGATIAIGRNLCCALTALAFAWALHLTQGALP